MKTQVVFFPFAAVVFGGLIGGFGNLGGRGPMYTILSTGFDLVSSVFVGGGGGGISRLWVTIGNSLASSSVNRSVCIP